MQAFLIKLLSGIAVPILEWVYGKLAKWIERSNRLKKGYEEAREKNAQIRENTEKAETKEERKDALRSDLHNF